MYKSAGKRGSVMQAKTNQGGARLRYDEGMAVGSAQPRVNTKASSLGSALKSGATPGGTPARNSPKAAEAIVAEPSPQRQASPPRKEEQAVSVNPSRENVRAFSARSDAPKFAPNNATSTPGARRAQAGAPLPAAPSAAAASASDPNPRSRNAFGNGPRGVGKVNSARGDFSEGNDMQLAKSERMQQALSARDLRRSAGDDGLSRAYSEATLPSGSPPGDDQRDQLVPRGARSASPPPQESREEAQKAQSMSMQNLGQNSSRNLERDYSDFSTYRRIRQKLMNTELSTTAGSLSARSLRPSSCFLSNTRGGSRVEATPLAHTSGKAIKKHDDAHADQPKPLKGQGSLHGSGAVVVKDQAAAATPGTKILDLGSTVAGIYDRGLQKLAGETEGKKNSRLQGFTDRYVRSQASGLVMKSIFAGDGLNHFEEQDPRRGSTDNLLVNPATMQAAGLEVQVDVCNLGSPSYLLQGTWDGIMASTDGIRSASGPRRMYTKHNQIEKEAGNRSKAISITARGCEPIEVKHNQKSRSKDMRECIEGENIEGLGRKMGLTSQEVQKWKNKESGFIKKALAGKAMHNDIDIFGDHEVMVQRSGKAVGAFHFGAGLCGDAAENAAGIQKSTDRRRRGKSVGECAGGMEPEEWYMRRAREHTRYNPAEPGEMVASRKAFPSRSAYGTEDTSPIEHVEHARAVPHGGSTRTSEKLNSDNMSLAMRYMSPTEVMIERERRFEAETDFGTKCQDTVDTHRNTKRLNANYAPLLHHLTSTGVLGSMRDCHYSN